MNRDFSPVKFLLASALLLPPILTITACASRQNLEGREQRPFFQQEQAIDTHGRKNWIDRLIEADPGQLKVEMASDYDDHPPAIIAVMPFCDKGNANFTVDKIPVTFRNKDEQDQWAWTDAQRLRRSVMGYLAQREFTVINPIAVDAVLKQRGIDNMDKLRRVSPVELGKLLGADALVYGEVNNYEGYYFGLVSAYQVGVDTWMLSARDGETLMRESGGRYSVDVSPAFSPQDIVINSVTTLLEFRDVTLARAEDEVSREMVLRIPVSEKLRQQMADAAIAHAKEVEAAQEETDLTPSLRHTIGARADLALSTLFGHGRASHFGKASLTIPARQTGETAWPVAQ